MAEQNELNLQKLTEIAEQRWFKSTEVFSIIRWAKAHPTGEFLITNLPNRPQNGSFYFLDGVKASKKWKHDGHEYPKRKNGVGFKEDTETLKIGGVKEVLCYYSQIESANALLTSPSDPTHRRIYKLIKKGGTNEADIFFVHYLADHSKKGTGSEKTANTTESDLNTTPLSTLNLTSYTTEESTICPKKQIPDKQSNQIQTFQETCSPSQANFPSKTGQDSLLFEDFGAEKCYEMEEFERSRLAQEGDSYQNIFFSPVQIGQASSPHLERQFNEFSMEYLLNEPQNQLPVQNSRDPNDTSQETSQTLSFENFSYMRNKIKELEDRIMLMQLEKQNSKEDSNFPLPFGGLPQQCEPKVLMESEEDRSTSQFGGNISDISSELLNIVDFSPEWDFTKGGTKVILCVNPVLDLADSFSEKLQVSFGGVKVPAYLIQPGVIKCNAPQHPQGYVKLSISQNGTCISKPNKITLFEFRKQQSVKKQRRGIHNDLMDSDDENISKQFKVRVIQKIQSLGASDSESAGTKYCDGNNTNNHSQSNRASHVNSSNPEQKSRLQDPTDITLQSLDDDSCFEQVKAAFEGLVSSHSKIQFTAQLNTPDSHGFCLLHYLVYLGFQQTCEFILEKGAMPSKIAQGGITPLELALSLTNEAMIETLIRHGSLLDQNSKALLKDLNEKAMHSINLESILTNPNMVDMLIREVSLCDSIHNSVGGDSLSLRVNFGSQGHEDDDDDESSYISLSDLIEDMNTLDSERCDAFRRDTCHPEPRLNANRRKQRRYLRDYDRRSAQGLDKNSSQKTEPSSNVVNAHANKQNYIQLIQKNVRGWLLRRQYLDTLHATRVLQSYIRKKISRKSISDQCDQKIEDMVKDWLKNNTKKAAN